VPKAPFDTPKRVCDRTPKGLQQRSFTPKIAKQIITAYIKVAAHFLTNPEESFFRLVVFEEPRNYASI